MIEEKKRIGIYQTLNNKDILKTNKLIFFVCMWLDTRFHYVFYRGKNNIYFISLYFSLFFMLYRGKIEILHLFPFKRQRIYIFILRCVYKYLYNRKNIYIQMDVTA